MGKLLEQLPQLGRGHLGVVLGFAVVPGAPKRGMHSGWFNALREDRQQGICDARILPGMPEQKVRQFVSHYLRAVAFTRRCNMEDVVARIEGQNDATWRISSAQVRQFVKVQRAAALDRQLTAYFPYSIGIRDFDSP
ncbi:hypothetical protein ACIRL3_25840 [Streptomyces sp. NPDC102384]|uniref:hypothetical protein n=1 Tax=Streptomyces sp. NPDC102384 TaxID=3366166 RepID=UPI0038117FF5